MNNFIKLGVFSNFLIIPLSAHAIPVGDGLDLAVTAEIVSDYRSRGQSQTLNDPAVQVGATLTHSSGLYGALWTSNVNFGQGSKTREEIDYVGGYYLTFTQKVGLDIGYAKYAYENQAGLNYSETYAVLNAYGFKLGSQYSDNLFGNQSYVWNWISYDTVLPADVGLNLHLGNADYKDDIMFSKSGNPRQSYNEWSAKISKKLFTLDWSLAYVDTDMSRSECASLLGYRDVCSATLVAGVKKSF